MTGSFQLDIDLDADGRADGHLQVKATSEHSPFGSAMMPVTSIRNGKGPCVIVMGGCHGDEYEGQLVARSILTAIQPNMLTGQLIVLPAANPIAVRAGRRYSPIDDGNLNAAFPGNPKGTATQRIAHFLETEMLPRADLVIDMHAGGRPVDYVASAMLSGKVEGANRERLVSLVKLLGLPVAFFVDDEDYTAASTIGACDRLGVLNISPEVGGGGSVRKSDLDQLREGVLRVMHGIGLLKAAVEADPGEVRFLRRLPISATVCAPARGLFEPAVELAQPVAAGDLAGLLHDIETPWKEPMPIRFADDGLVLCRRLPVMVEAGDGLIKLAVPINQ